MSALSRTIAALVASAFPVISAGCSGGDADRRETGRPVAREAAPPAPAVPSNYSQRHGFDPSAMNSLSMARVGTLTIIGGSMREPATAVGYPNMTIVNSGDTARTLAFVECKPTAPMIVLERTTHVDGWCGTVETRKVQFFDIPPGETVRVGQNSNLEVAVNFRTWDWSRNRMGVPPTAGDKLELTLVVRDDDEFHSVHVPIRVVERAVRASAAKAIARRAPSS